MSGIAGNENQAYMDNEGDEVEMHEAPQIQDEQQGNDTDTTNSEDSHKEKEDTSIFSYVPFIAEFIKLLKENKKIIAKLVLLAFCLGFIAYIISASIIDSCLDDFDYWCNGDGVLYICTGIVVICLVYFQILKRYFGNELHSYIFEPLQTFFTNLYDIRFVPIFTFLVLIGGVITFYALDIDDIDEEYERLISIGGFFFFIAMLFVFSKNPRRVRWRHTIWAAGIQFVMGLIVLRWETGADIFTCLSDKVVTFLGFTDEGSIFVFGETLVSDLHIFAFSVMPVVLYFSFFVSLLYYLGAVQWIVLKVGWWVQISVGTTLCESLNAVANIFLGQTEAPLLIRPYLPDMTKSEIHAIMTGGFASVSGSVLAAYISFGADPRILLTACVMNAPGSLGVSKLFYPETEKTRIDENTIAAIKSEEVNALHAASVGVSNAISLVANIMANLIAFIAFIALINSLLNWSCGLLDLENGTCSLESLLGYIFTPIAFIMGVEWDDCYNVGQLLGLKTVVNEYVAYGKLGEMQDEGIITERSIYIATFALCGFANLSSIGIQMGGLSPMAPERKGDLAKIVVRAMIAGCITNFMTACIAGSLVTPTMLIDGNSTSTLPTDISEHCMYLYNDTLA